MTKEITISTNFLQSYPREVVNTCRNTLYPGAKDESILMVLDYCKAANLDVLLKPIHIVPLNVMNKVTNRYEYRDAVMPGIGLYRINASRSGAYAGIGKTKYGPPVTLKLGSVTLTVPEWSEVTVKRIVQGVICEFTAELFWEEEYARTSKNDPTPTQFWIKRKHSQLSKCCEAAALRKAFPESVSHQESAEEMEGKEIEESNIKTVNESPINNYDAYMIDGQLINAGVLHVLIQTHLEAINGIESLNLYKDWFTRNNESLSLFAKKFRDECFDYSRQYSEKKALFQEEKTTPEVVKE